MFQINLIKNLAEKAFDLVRNKETVNLDWPFKKKGRKENLV